jgi:hypothetical protein
MTAPVVARREEIAAAATCRTATTLSRTASRWTIMWLSCRRNQAQPVDR